MDRVPIGFKTRSIALGALLTLLPAGPARAALPSFAQDQAANLAVGQPDTNSGSANQGASASSNTLNLPFGAYSDGTRLYVADAQNNRVLIYNQIPTANGALANVVVGQPDMVSTQQNQGTGGAAANSLSAPSGVFSDGTRLYIADTFNNRVLIYNTIPTANNASANVVLGQTGMTANSTVFSATANTLTLPYALTSDGTNLYVADSGNNRVLRYPISSLSNGAAASLVIGQPDFTHNAVNQGLGYGSAAAYTLLGPTGVSTDTANLYVADNSNNRVLLYALASLTNGATAYAAVGQQDLVSNLQNQGNASAAATTLSGPESVYSDGTNLYVADYQNNRALIYEPIPTSNGASAALSLGQPDLVSNQTNQGNSSASNSTLSNPSAIASDGRQLYLTDSGNSRVLEFGMPAPTGLAGAGQGDSSMTWTWNAVAGATGYDFYPSTGGPAIPVTGTALTQTGLSTNTAYGAQVSATNAGSQGILSSAATAYTLTAPPTGFALVSFSSNSVAVGWGANTNPGGTLFLVQISSVPGFGAPVTTQVLTGLTTTFLNLAPGTTYYAQVFGENGNGVLTPDTATLSAFTALPSAPTGVAGTGQATCAILWTWNPILNAVGYDLYSTTSPGTLMGSAASTSFTEGGLSTNTAYGVLVQAVTPGGGGPLSAAASAYTLAAPPSGLAATVVGISSTTLGWSANSNPGGTLFLVQISSVSGFGTPVTTQALTGLTTTFLNLAAGTAYSAQVFAENGNGILTADASVLSVQTTLLPPAGPALSAVAVSTGSILWQWPAPTGLAQAGSFSLWASTGGLVAQLPALTTAYLETGISQGTTVALYLEATNLGGTSFSSTVTVVTPELGNFTAGTTSAGTIADPITGTTALSIPAGALAQSGVWLMSPDPASAPLVSGMPALIAQAH